MANSSHLNKSKCNEGVQKERCIRNSTNHLPNTFLNIRPIIDGAKIAFIQGVPKKRKLLKMIYC